MSNYKNCGSGTKELWKDPEYRKKMSTAHKGQKAWNKNIPLSEQMTQDQNEKRKEKISTTMKEQYGTGKRVNWLKGKTHSEKSKEKTRISLIQYREKTYGGCFPNIGINETRILDELELSLECKIIRQYSVCGYFVDGYCKTSNIVFEIDEDCHLYQKKQDDLRQNNIQDELNCTFVRIKDE